MAGMCGLVGGGGGAAGALGTMFAAMADYGGASASWSGRGWNFGLRHRAEAAAPQPGVGGFAITAVARLDDRDALCDALGLPPLEGAPSVPRRVWREALADVAAVAQQEGLQVFHEPSNATQIVAQLREDLATPQLIHDAAEIPVQAEPSRTGCGRCFRVGEATKASPISARGATPPCCSADAGANLPP